MSTWVCIQRYVCLSVCLSVYLSVRMYVCTSIYIYIDMYVYIYTYTFMIIFRYTYIHTYYIPPTIMPHQKNMDHWHMSHDHVSCRHVCESQDTQGPNPNRFFPGHEVWPLEWSVGRCHPRWYWNHSYIPKLWFRGAFALGRFKAQIGKDGHGRKSWSIYILQNGPPYTYLPQELAQQPWVAHLQLL